MPKVKTYIGYWLLAISMLLLLYLLFKSWQRSQQIDEALKQTPLEVNQNEKNNFTN